tara:strand:- start:1348 stop:1527 length:180 start_codon:yes stop_codon:yes gene_type:complete
MEYNIWNLPNDFWALEDIYDEIICKIPEEQTIPDSDLSDKEKAILYAIASKQLKLIKEE